jgi:hypothetical protein
MVACSAILVRPSGLANLRVKLGGLVQARGQRLEQQKHVYRARPWLFFAGVLSSYDIARAVAGSRTRAYLQLLSLVSGFVGSLVISRISGWQAWLLFAVGLVLSGSDFAAEIRSIRAEDLSCDIIDLSGDSAHTTALAATVASSDDLVEFSSSLALHRLDIDAELSRQSASSGGGLTMVEWVSDAAPLPARVQQWRRQILLNRYRTARGNRPFTVSWSNRRPAAKSSRTTVPARCGCKRRGTSTSCPSII